MKIVQIVSQIPSRAMTDGGINDGANLLAEEMSKQDDFLTDFVQNKCLRSDQNLQAFSQQLSSEISAVILHYHFKWFKNPFATLRVLQAAKRTSNFKLIIIIHEFSTIYAFRFLFPLYKIFQLADVVIVHSNNIKNVISKVLFKTPVFCFPSFSQVGEPQTVPSLKEREPNMVVFGSKWSRPYMYENFSKNLLTACQSLGIQKIYDIGAPCDLPFHEFQEIPIIELGVQPKEIISQLMLSSKAGFLDYSRFQGELTKSGVFAAFTSHGLVPILTKNNYSKADGLEMNKHYLVSDNNLSNLNLSQLQQIADNGYIWYQNHTLAQMSKFLISCILTEK